MRTTNQKSNRMNPTTQQLFETHNKKLLTAIMQESENLKALRKITKKYGLCLN